MLEKTTKFANGLWPLLGQAARSVGAGMFYDHLGAAFAYAVGVDRWLVMRFSRSRQPEILCNHGGMTAESICFYDSGLYRLDPLHRLTQEDAPPSMVVISRLRAHDLENRYYDEIYRTALIRDEIALILPVRPGLFITLNLDSADEEFSNKIIARAETVADAFRGLHETHAAQTAVTGPSNVETGPPPPSLPAYDALIATMATRHGMTDREQEIAHRALRGYPNALIARDLGIAVGTVRNHRARLYAKLDITSERELFAICLDTLLDEGCGA
ncbi:MAG: helix-turn-helix transcriptional regulator [Rhodobacteraceae bacterium]|nr:helix-turn-helix transcriptional regulator [Paracoccaceae bacterium]